jgi:hypothetical protein
MYDDSEWTEQGATLSDKAAIQKYGLTRTEILAAMRAGKLQFREQSMHGNPWFRLLRREVEALVAEERGDAALQAQKITAELAEIDRQLRALKRQAAKLERRRSELSTMLEPERQVRKKP